MVDKRGKKTKNAKGSDGANVSQFDGELQKLKEIQNELEKINEEVNEKVLEVDQKYNQIRKPVFDKRCEVIKSIPDFWPTAFCNHPVLGYLLTEEDHKMFKYLSSLEVEEAKDVKSGFSITFSFNPNPYFEDTKLTKTFASLDEGTTKIASSPINWKEGMGLPKPVKNDKKGNKQSFAETSFFTWFSDSEQNDDDDETYDQVAEIIKKDLWLSPLDYFKNVGEEDERDKRG